MSTLLDQALAIAASGLPVFPCALNSTEKSPVCVGGHKAATKDRGRILSLFSHSAANIIGMPTGEVSGLVVIDIDPRHDGNVWHEANKSRLPVTRTHRTLQGGLHLVFNDGGHGIRNSAGKFNRATGRSTGIAEGVDVRGNGGWVVWPPSPGYSVLDEAPVADMPDWLVELCRKKPDDAPDAAAPGVQVRPWGTVTAKPDASPYGAEALKRAADEIRHAPDGAKRDTINREAYSMGGLVASGHILESDAWNALSGALSEILPRCTNRRAAQKTLRDGFEEGKRKPRDIPDRAPEIEQDDHLIAPFMAKHADGLNAILQRAAGAKPLPVRADLMDVEGALKLFVDYCQDTAISPQPFLALAAGITAIGVLAGRKYRTVTNLRTNVFAVGIADSGGGKDHARRQIKRVFSAGGLTDYLGGEDIASGTAMLTALFRFPAQLFQIDEFGDFLSDVLGPKASPHKKQIAQRLKTLYSSAGEFISGTEYADQSRTGKPRQDIIQPHACMYGTTTPGQFWRAIADASLEDGFLARFFIFVSPENYPDERDAVYIEPPADLVDAFKAIATGPADAGGGNLAGVMLAATAPVPLLVNMTPEAEASYKEARRLQLTKQRGHEGTYRTAIVGRMAENATKLALIRAVSRDPRYPVITEADMTWGWAIAEHCVETLLREAGDNVAETQYERDVQKAKKTVRAIGSCTKRDMQRKGWRLPEKVADDILRMLVETGEIIATVKEGGTGKGRPAVYYTPGLR